MAFKLAVYDQFFKFVSFGRTFIPSFKGCGVSGIQLKCYFYILSCIYKINQNFCDFGGDMYSLGEADTINACIMSCVDQCGSFDFTEVESVNTASRCPHKELQTNKNRTIMDSCVNKVSFLHYH